MKTNTFHGLDLNKEKGTPIKQLTQVENLIQDYVNVNTWVHNVDNRIWLYSKKLTSVLNYTVIQIIWKHKQVCIGTFITEFFKAVVVNPFYLNSCRLK